MIIETTRLTLRRLDAEDAAFMLGLLNEASFIQNIGDRGVRTIDDAIEYIAKGPQASYQRFGFGLYLVTLKDTGASIGICGLLKRDELPHADIGFAFLPAYWSRGYALESATAVKAYAVETIGLDRLLAIVNPSNLSSIRLLEKLGFTFESMVTLPPGPRELKLFGCNIDSQLS